MTQRYQSSCVTRVIVLVQNKGKETKQHTSCEKKTRELPKGTRKQGGLACADCGVQKPILLSEWLEKMNWADGATFLLEQAKSLGRIVGFCAAQGWLQDATVSDARDWLTDQLSLSILTLVNAGHLTRLIGDGLTLNLKAVTQRKNFFCPAFRGVIQNEVLDCARRLSIELWRDGNKSDVVLRPGGQYYAYLHSLCLFLYKTRQEVTMEGLCESIDTAYPEFSAQTKRLVFAFLLVMEYARRLNRFQGKGIGISEKRRGMILDFIDRSSSAR